MRLMGTPATDREKHLRREIANYLRAVKVARQWKNRHIAAAAGYSTPAQVSKIFSLVHTMGADKLLRIQELTDMPWPQSLKDAILAHGAPVQTVPEGLSLTMDQIKALPAEVREALLAHLPRKAS
jgi:hypothetical protein